MPEKYSRQETVDYVAGIFKKNAETAYDAVVKQAKAAGHPCLSAHHGPREKQTRAGQV